MKPISHIYSRSTADGVWHRPDHGAFGYSDGDEVEGRMASIIAAAQDCSVLSPELRSHIVDWPTKYHLSSQRANILRPLAASLRGSVLEIGSGCGAITRYLGETALSVTALEGSRRRAHITRLRTRELFNVEVICDEFSAFETEQRFDVVTLIGVLEYANMFVHSDQPAQSMLTKARSMLDADGCLIIAIENQLGLKYWAGAPEDHLGQAMLGLEDKYQADGVRTYGKRTLHRLLINAGFQSVDFLYPFPDYKLPSCVLAERAFSDPAFDPEPFLVLTSGKDHHLPAEPGFTLERVWPVIHANGLTTDVANSFLIVARPGAPSQTTDANAIHKLAWHFSTQRLPQFCKETVFGHDQNGSGISIERTRLSPATTYPAPTIPGLTHHLEDDTPYVALPLLSRALIDMITRPGWTDRQLADFVLLYARHVSQIARIELVREGRICWEQPVPGWLFDCIPQNIRQHADGTCSAFDLEWRLDHDISFVQLVFRGLWHTVGGLTQIGTHASESRMSVLEMTTRALRLLGSELTTDAAEAMVRYEVEMQKALSGDTTGWEQVWLWLSNGAQPQANAHQRLAEVSGQVHELQSHLAQWRQHGRNLEQEVVNRDVALVDLRRHCDHLEAKSTHMEAKSDGLQRQVEQLATALQVKDKSVQNAHRATQAIIERATIDSLRNNHALHRLSRELTKAHLQSRSAKTLLKLNRDLHRVHALGTSPSAPQRPPLPYRWASVLRAWQQPKPVVIGVSDVEQAGHAEHLMTQSCHWNFPFEWRFRSSEPSVLQAAANVANQLDIAANMMPATGSGGLTDASWLSALSNQAYIAMPCIVCASRAPQNNNGALPDAELLRLSYVALLCDPGLSAVYVGAKESTRSEADSPATHPVVLLARVSACAAHPSLLSFGSAFLSSSDLAEEIGRACSVFDKLRQRVLVI